MPKRYREWMLKDNVAKPRSTQIRHAKKAALTPDSAQVGNAGHIIVEAQDTAGDASFLRLYMSADEEAATTDNDGSSTNVCKLSDDSTSDVELSDADGSFLNNTTSGADLAAAHESTDYTENDSSDLDSDTSDEEDNSTENETKSELDEDLYPGSRITVGESLMLILGHSLRHSSTKEATESMLQLIEAHLPKEAAIATTKYLFFKQFVNARETATYHFYCQNCFEYLGKDVTAEFHCLTCNTDFDVDTLMKDESYFLTFDIAEQMKDKLSLPELSFNLLSRNLSYDVGELTSKGYHDLPTSENDLSVTWNTDGVPLYESSGYSIWPLLLQINELPQKVRTKHILLAGLWFGHKKPKMNTFLKPFVDEVNHLSATGFLWKDSQGNAQQVRVFPGPCSVDTVARAMVMNMSQFNGSHGCGWCVHEGEVVRRGNGHARVYPLLSHEPAARTPESFLDYAAEADEANEPKYGVKGPSVLFLLAFFSFPANFVVDYMHAVCAGFVRHTTCMWFESKALFSYSLGSMVDEVDRRLSDLRPIWELSRLPRSLKVRRYWKASEWRNWLLFFSPVVLHCILPSVYYKNWLKFVRLMHFFLADTVPTDKLNEARKAMHLFLREYQDLYGKEHMTFNAHLLSHLVDSVEIWGPLWNYSAYAFENMNGQLVRLVNGTRYAHWQIVEKFCFLSSLPKIWSKCSHFQGSDSKHRLMLYFLKGYQLKRHSESTRGIVFFGKGKHGSHGMLYRKVRINGFTYCIRSLDKSRRLNSFVCVSDTFGRIDAIRAVCREGHTSCKCAKDVVFRLYKLEILRSFLVDNINGTIMYEVVSTNNAVEMSCNDPQKCMAMFVSSKIFLCRVGQTCTLEAV